VKSFHGFFISLQNNIAIKENPELQITNKKNNNQNLKFKTNRSSRFRVQGWDEKVSFNFSLICYLGFVVCDFIVFIFGTYTRGVSNL